MEKVFDLWTITQRKNEGSWQATRRINGVLYTVHVGSNPDRAEKRVEEYCKEKGIDPHAASGKKGPPIVNASELEKRVKLLEKTVQALQDANMSQVRTLEAQNAMLEKLFEITKVGILETQVRSTAGSMKKRSAKK